VLSFAVSLFKLLEKLVDGPMRQSLRAFAACPCKGDGIHHHEILVVGVLPLGEVIGVAECVANLLGEPKKVGLE